MASSSMMDTCQQTRYGRHKKHGTETTFLWKTFEFVIRSWCTIIFNSASIQLHRYGIGDNGAPYLLNSFADFSNNFICLYQGIKVLNLVSLLGFRATMKREVLMTKPMLLLLSLGALPFLFKVLILQASARRCRGRGTRCADAYTKRCSPENPSSYHLLQLRTRQQKRQRETELGKALLYRSLS